MITGGTSQPLFRWDAATGRLYINTPIMKLIFDSGAVVHVYDRIRNETLLDAIVTENMPAHTWGFIGFASTQTGTGNVAERVCNAATATFSKTGQAAILTYSPCYRQGSPVTGTSLEYTFEVDAAGEILISIKATEAEETYAPYTTDLPVMNFTKTSVIRAARRVLFTEPDSTTNYLGKANVTNNFPVVAIFEGNNSCFSIWSENNKILDNEFMCHYHYQNNYDTVVYHTSIDRIQSVVNPLEMQAGPFRITVQSNWVEVARKWRSSFISLYPDTKYLWDNPVNWVKNIHCVISTANHTESEWNDIAAVVPPANCILYPSTGANLICEQDPTWRFIFASPQDSDIPFIQTHGWKMIYHGQYCLITYAPDVRMAQYPTSIPAGYPLANFPDSDHPELFDPPYPGDIGWDAWEAWAADVLYAYDDYLKIMHPASIKNKDRFAMFMPAMMKRWGEGAGGYSLMYWDIGGSLPSEVPILNNKTFLQGTIDMMKDWFGTYPISTEVMQPDTIPYCWWTWQSFGSMNAVDTVNHPLLAALVGSFAWTRESGVSQLSGSAYVGALPSFIMSGSGYAYSQDRAQLFCTYELFNDLPTTWINSGSYTTLAYYRSNTGNMFRFEDRGSGTYAYVEEVPGGDVDRLTYP